MRELIILAVFLGLGRTESIIIDALPYNWNGLKSGDGVLIIVESRMEILLYGRNLNNIAKVGLSLVAGSFEEVCTANHIPVDMNFTSIGKDGKRGLLNYAWSVLLPLDAPLYLCTKDIGAVDWLHQGKGIVLKVGEPSYGLNIYLGITMTIVVLILAAILSGMNLGLMALTPRELELVKASGTPKEKEYAEKIYPVRKKGNVLLVTILLGLTLFTSAATVLIDQMITSLSAVIIATIVEVIFSELIPQSIFSRHGLVASASTLLLIEILLVVTFPLSYPMGKFLDYMLGHEPSISYNRKQLLEVFRLNKDGNLEEDEFDIIRGGLKLKSKTTRKIMTPLKDCFMLSEDTVLNFQTISDIVQSGFSRIPVYKGDRSNVIGLFMLKDTIFIETEDMIPLKSIIKFYNHSFLKVTQNTTLDILLKEFKKGVVDIGIVVKKTEKERDEVSYEAVGVVTLEDLVEEIIHCEIIDEKDWEKENNYYRKNKFKGGVWTRRKKIKRGFSHLEQDQTEELTDNMVLTLCEFLTTSVHAFSPNYIKPEILKKLLKQKNITIVAKEDKKEVYLYQKGVTADYFVVVIDGRVEVTIGVDNHSYVETNFSFFGQSCLDPSYDFDVSGNTYKMPKTFVPDFSVRVLGTVLLARIPSHLYNLAVRSSKISTIAESGATQHEIPL